MKLARGALLSAYEAGLLLASVISESGLPIPQLLMIPSPEAQAFRFTKKTQIQKANFLKMGTHRLIVILGSKWLIADVSESKF